jgi:UDP-N-acetylmuramoyl-L-alanyl-D-glutamate--2,6-diaminopimelate ligase
VVHTAIFTNFTQDHLDYHGTMQAYWAAKAKLFDWPGLKAAVINIDDARGHSLAEELKSRALDVWTVSANGPARLSAHAIRYGLNTMSFEVHEGQTVCQICAPVVGSYNVANLLGVIAALRSLGLPLQKIADSCSGLSPVPGRMETLAIEGRPLVVIDYAHTPDALTKVLQALRPLARQRGGRLCCVFGCGGDRDASKRPLMAAAAAAGADHLVITSDNPRSEDAKAIMADILTGLPASASVHVQADRAIAIATALQQAGAQDVVLVAGKGHENYQEILGQKLPFSDRALAEAALASYTMQVSGVGA